MPECPGGVFERFERAGPLWGEERCVPRPSSRCDVSSDGECGVRGLGRWQQSRAICARNAAFGRKVSPVCAIKPRFG